jgi:transcriptional regulator of heat shock response
MTRNESILDLVIREYIETAEPIGSRTLSKHTLLGLSAASIRNVMADLEELGFLRQPHTSAGRVPTGLGYRYWVDRLMEPVDLETEEEDRILEEINRARTIEGLADSICRVLSDLTGNAVVVYVKNLKRVSFLNHLLEELIRQQKIEDFFEEETELFMDGALRMLEQPEFQDAVKMKALLRLFHEKVQVLNELLREHEQNTVHVQIGRENEMGIMEDVSVVNKDCMLSQTPIGGVAVVGPIRMNYPKVVSAVDFVADAVSEKMRRY